MSRFDKAVSVLFGRDVPVVSPLHYARVTDELARLGGDSGLILAENYAGGSVYANGHIKPRLRQLGVPYISCEVRMVRPRPGYPIPKIESPTWPEYSQLMKELEDPWHIFVDDKMSEQAFGASFLFHWLTSHGVEESKIKYVAEFDSSGTADHCIVRGFKRRIDKRQALNYLIDQGVIPAELEEPYNPLLTLVTPKNVQTDSSPKEPYNPLVTLVRSLDPLLFAKEFGV